jgi:hypothetical protein
VLSKQFGLGRHSLPSSLWTNAAHSNVKAARRIVKPLLRWLEKQRQHGWAMP